MPRLADHGITGENRGGNGDGGGGQGKDGGFHEILQEGLMYKTKRENSVNPIMF